MSEVNSSRGSGAMDDEERSTEGQGEALQRLPKLTDMQERFVTEYLKDLNGKQAAIRAGFSLTSADSYAYELLRLPEVVARIEFDKARLAALSNVSSVKMLAWLKHVQESDYTEAFNVNFELKSKDEIPVELRKLIQSITVIKKATRLGQDIHVKVQFVDKMRSAEIISKYLGMFDVKESGTGFSLTINQANITQINEIPQKSISMGGFALDVPIDILPENTSS